MKRDVYSYVYPEYSKWKGVCISAVGNLYCNEYFNSEAEARQAVFENIKSMLNEKHPREDWYTIKEKEIDSEEVEEAWVYFNIFTHQSWKQNLIYKLQIFYLKVCMWKRWIIG